MALSAPSSPEDKCFETHARTGPAVPSLQGPAPHRKGSRSKSRMRVRRGVRPGSPRGGRMPQGRDPNAGSPSRPHVDVAQ